MLMSNLGYLTMDFWGALWQYWPVIMVSLGLTMLLARSRWAFVGPLVLVIAILYFAFAPGAPYAGPRLGMGRHHWQRSSVFTKPWEPSVEQGELRVELGAGSLDVLGSSQQLLSGNISYRLGAVPVWAFEHQGKKAVTRVKGERDHGWFGSNRGYRGSIALGSMVPWDVHLKIGAGNLQGDFRNVMLTSLRIEVGAGNVDITLPNQGIRGQVRIDGGVSSVNVRVPRNVGVRLQVSSPIGTKNLKEMGLKNVGQYWVSENYETAASAYDIVVSMGVSKLRFDYVPDYPRI